MSIAKTERAGIFGWIDRRYGVAPLVEYMRHKEVPVGAHSMVWYYLGGITLFFFSVQVITGILLLAYYEAGENTSYESIRFLTTKVPFGWLVRSMHCWSAHLMIVSLLSHMFSTMMLKAYRPPRELTWVSGVGLLAMALGFGFSGYLLPWNELSFFATVVGTDSMKAVPVIGGWLLQVLRGGGDVTIHTLYRFFALHVVVLPLVIVGLVSFHLILIQRQGMAKPVAHTPGRRGLRFFPDFMLRDLLLWLVCLILLASLAVFIPYGLGIPGFEWELGKKANPLAPAYPGIKPEWYFLWIYQLLKEFPSHLFGLEGPEAAVGLVSVLLGLWAAIPWLDRKAQREERSPGFTDLGCAALLFLGDLTLKAWDIGGGGVHGAHVDAVASARVTALLALGLCGVTVAFRAFVLRQRWFIFTICTALQIALHGLFGLHYLVAAAIALATLAAALTAQSRRARRISAAAAQIPAAAGPP
jgi:cytochrome b6